MPAPRSLMLLQCVSAPASTHDEGGWWLAECYLTSDGPRMRLVPVPSGSHRCTEQEARAELARRQDIVTPRPRNTVEGGIVYDENGGSWGGGV